MDLSEPNFTDAAEQARLGEALLQHLADAFRSEGALIETNAASRPAQIMIDRDEDLLSAALAERSLAGDGRNIAVRVWRNHRVLVVPRAFRHHPGFARAISQSGEQVMLRKSGGSTVIHGPHVLNISIALAPVAPSRFSISNCYHALAAAILPKLDALGVRAELADVPAAHCPGRYSFVSADRKLGGTAAFTRRTAQGMAGIVHTCISLWQDPRDLTEIAAFDRAVGLETNYKENAHISLEEALMRPKE